MPNLLFSLLESKDPEERLENAMLWKAMSDVYGDKIHPITADDKVQPGDMIFGMPTGRQLRTSGSDVPKDYWNWEPFTSRLSRDFHVCNYEEAQAAVASLNEAGKAPFVKALRDKFYVERGEHGQSLEEILGDMVYSFCDYDTPVLMIQEAVDFSHEYRCIIVDGQVVTGSPVLHAATPAARLMMRGDNPEARLYKSPSDPISSGKHAGVVVSNMKAIAAEMAQELRLTSGTIDLGLIGGDPGRIEPIEINSGLPGRYGLYFADPVKIAEATRSIVPEALLSNERSQQIDELEPSPRDLLKILEMSDSESLDL